MTPQPQADNLDTRLRAHYRRESLDPDLLAHLRAVVGATADTRRPRLATVAVLLLAATVVVGILGWILTHPAWNRGPYQLAESAAAEIARNHNKNLASEFLATRFRELDAPMAKLDFTLVPPARMRTEGLRLVGARYCRIGGRIAAQIRLTDSQNERLTLYEFEPGEEYQGLEESTFEVSGLEVTVWLESGLVMGLARPLR